MTFKIHKDILADIEKTKVDAENLIRNLIPQRIAAIKALLVSEDFSGDLSAPAGIQELNGLKITEGASEQTGDVILQGNARIRRLLDTLKPHCIQMFQDFDLIKQWLYLTIPKVEDGNNFGVDVLESVLNKVDNFANYCTGFPALCVKVAEVRAKVVSKILKHPLVDDYKNMLKQLDEEDLIVVQRYCLGLYRSYVAAYALIIKNFEKVTNPRAVNYSQNMY